MTTHDELHDVLHRLEEVVDDVRGTVVTARDGLSIASTLPDSERDRMAAIAATVAALGQQLVGATFSFTLEHAVVRGGEGCLAVYGAGDTAALAVLTGARPNMGLLHVEAQQAAGDLAGLLTLRGSA